MENWITGITAPVAFAAIALLGYIVGRGQQKSNSDRLAVEQEMLRVQTMAGDLERISRQLRENLAIHHSRVIRWRAAIQTISDRCDGAHDQTTRSELRKAILPTDELSHDIAVAYDELRRHSDSLTRLHA